eukprot:12163195-Prorocentrum_lima.AAC.1
MEGCLCAMVGRTFGGLCGPATGPPIPGGSPGPAAGLPLLPSFVCPCSPLPVAQPPAVAHPGP